ncbi:flavin reductase family protein [Fulvivirgaceae bacterium BMA10]|uniref:Flavin reductase family protein n=1 Tax=Splendidivirga corallicola TaxID=3051826 RepID=A0ABT8KJJ1_9BACT|nr:flavin reductase family protein [Fulvivirgaceae bacterium BMA10]
MKTIKPKQLSVAEFHGYLLGAVAPRPIAFASTIDKNGNINLSPFSFFNCFSANPPILIFSPARRVRDNTIKHTLENALETKEVVINIVDHKMVEQMSLASTEYDKGINEFIKSGLTELPSTEIKPPRVAESPVSFECKVKEVVALGEEGGAGNLVICEVLVLHIKEEVLDDEGKIDPFKIDLVARMGGDWYCRASEASIFKIPKPNRNKGIGFDNIPEHIRNSKVLTGNNLGRLGNITKLPDQRDVELFKKNPHIKQIMNDHNGDKKSTEIKLHTLAQDLLEKGDLEGAWKALLQRLLP